MSDITPIQRAFLNSIYAGESSGRYDVIYGGGKITDFSDHPRRAVRITSGPNAGKTSSAAGAPQFLGSTWDEAKNALGLPDFSPESQDKAAVWLAGRDYKKRTGRDLWSDVEAAGGDAAKINEIGSNLSGTWTSLPSGAERNSATAGFGQRVATELSAQSKSSSPASWGAIPVEEDGPASWGAIPVDESKKDDRSLVQKAISPITDYPQIHAEMADESFRQAKRGVGQIASSITGQDDQGKELTAAERAANVAYGAGNAALGGLGWATSGINSSVRALLSKPLEESIGVPKEITELATAFVPGMGVSRAGALRPASVPLPSRPALSAGEKVVQSANQLENTTGVPVNIPRAVASDSPIVNQAGQTLANMPVAGAPLRRSYGEMVEGLGEAATAVRSAYGSGNMASAGVGAREAMEAYTVSGPFRAKVDQAYDAVDKFVNQDVIGSLPNTRALRDSIVAGRNRSAIPESKNADLLEEALSRQGMDYPGIKGLRTYFGDMLDGKRSIPEGISENEVRSIYAALSKDMRLIIAKAGGQDGLKAWEKANRVAARWADMKGTLRGILGAKSDEGIVHRIMDAAGSTSRADIKMLGRARGAVGAERWDDISAAVIERMIDPPGGNGFSMDKFVTSFNKMTPQGRDILFRSKNHKPHSDAIDSIAAIAERGKQQYKAYANPSGTGQTVMTGAGFYGMARHPLSTVASVAGMGVAARVMAKPATARSLAALYRSYDRALTLNTPGAWKGYESASRLFSASVGTELSRSDVVPSLTRQLHQFVPGRAEEESVHPEREF